MPKIEIEMSEAEIRAFVKCPSDSFLLNESLKILASCKKWVENNPPHEWKVEDWAYHSALQITFKVAFVGDTFLNDQSGNIRTKSYCRPCKPPEVIK